MTLLPPNEGDTWFWYRARVDISKLGFGEKATPTKVAEEGCRAMKAGKIRIVAGKLCSKWFVMTINNLAPVTVKADLYAASAETWLEPKE